MHEIIRIVEVFPAPLGPRNPKDSPLAISKLMWSTAKKSPNLFTRSLATTRVRRAQVRRGRPRLSLRG